MMALIVIWMKMALKSIEEPSSDTQNTFDLWMEQLELKKISFEANPTSS